VKRTLRLEGDWPGFSGNGIVTIMWDDIVRSLAFQRFPGPRVDISMVRRRFGIATSLLPTLILFGAGAGVPEVRAQTLTSGLPVHSPSRDRDGRAPQDFPDADPWWLEAGLFAGAQAGSTPRRMLELPTSAEQRIWPVVGFELHAGFGPFRIDFTPRLEERLLDDPDWTSRERGDDRGIALRTPVARLIGEWRWVQVELGEAERNWGPAGIPGLLVSPLGYSRRGLGFSVGPEILRLQWRTERLSSEPSSSTGESAPRWFTVHRLRWRPSERWEVAVWEAMITSEDDGIDPARLNPLALYTFGQQFGIGDERNTSFGFDVAWRAADALWIETQLLVDDVVIWNADENPYPHRLGFTAQARQAPRGAWGWRAWATGVSALALTTFRPEEGFLNDGAGLGRTRPDHLAAGAEIRLKLGGGAPDQPQPSSPRARGFVQESWGAGAAADGWMPDAYSATPPSPGGAALRGIPGRLRLDLGVRWRRQGERRFSDPFPRPGSGPDVPDLPTFSPVIEGELFALHSALGWSWGPVDLTGEAQLQHRRVPATGESGEWGVEARAQLLWHVGRWSYRGR